MDKPIVLSMPLKSLNWAAARAGLELCFCADELGNADDGGVAAAYTSSFAYLDKVHVHSGNIFTQARSGLADPTDSSPQSLFSRGSHCHMNKDYDLFTLNTGALFGR